MSAGVYPDFSELAYHITILCDFWRRSDSLPQKDKLVRVIENMISTGLGIENAGPTARAVIGELDAIGIARTGREVDPDDIDVVFVTALLHEQASALAMPAGRYGS